LDTPRKAHQDNHHAAQKLNHSVRAVARSVADKVVFMDEGEIVEMNPPQEFFDNPKSERTKLFLSQILSH
jgi:ABC-type polar amino acid transport system ATPase subunit